MRVPLSWLRELVDCDLAPESLAERLTSVGLAVESIERVGPDLSGVRVGHVIEREKHPDADRLSVCQVAFGPEVNDGQPLTIVCGAPNVAAGQKVAVALPGTRLPDGTELKRSKIRGVVSNGMICSTRELGLGDEQAGILVLDDAARIGAPLCDVLPVRETVLDVELTPNRGDCASVLGVAREVRACLGGDLRLPDLTLDEDTQARTDAAIRVSIEDPAGCPRYVARVVEDVRVGPSPDWVRRRLEAAGMRSIDNVVDATNLVLLELGQPLHAFDLDAVRGGALCVRAAHAAERLRTIDGVERTLAADDLVIADAEGAIAIAGVMGGAASEVRESTRRILIESAQFDPSRVRRTVRRLGLRSEASYRFERGVDPAGVERAADRAAHLMARLAGGRVRAGVVCAGGPDVAEREVVLDPARVERLLGIPIAREHVAELLARVGIRSREDRGMLHCRIPSHRHDVTIPQDLIEEVARLHGFDRIPARMPVARLAPVEVAPHRRLTDELRDALVGAGQVEAVTLSFLDPADLERLDLSLDDRRRRTVPIRNPIGEQQSRLRTTLLPALLHAARENRARRVEVVRLFEAARVFLADGEGAAEGLPEERLTLAALWVRGERAALWEPADPPPLFFEARGVAERILLASGRTPSFAAGSGEPYHHPGASAEIRVEGVRIGSVGGLHPAAAAAFEIDAPCVLLELDLTALAQTQARPARYVEISNQPPVRRDIAVLLPAGVAAGEVVEAIRRSAGPSLTAVGVFDRYEGRGIPEGRVSLAFRLVFQRPDRAFTDPEIAKLIDRVVQMLSNRFGGELR